MDACTQKRHSSREEDSIRWPAPAAPIVHVDSMSLPALAPRDGSTAVRRFPAEVLTSDDVWRPMKAASGRAPTRVEVGSRALTEERADERHRRRAEREPDPHAAQQRVPERGAYRRVGVLERASVETQAPSCRRLFNLRVDFAKAWPNRLRDQRTRLPWRSVADEHDPEPARHQAECGGVVDDVLNDARCLQTNAQTDLE